MSIAERLRQAMKMRGMTQVELCEKTGLNKGAVSCYLSGQYEPKQRAIFKLAEALDVSELYLMGLSETPDHPAARTSDAAEPLDPVIAEIVKLSRSMTEEQRLALLQFVRSLSSHN